MSNSKRLTALQINGITKPGSYGDGMGLMLLVKSSGTKSWILRARYNGKRRDFGLGGYPSISLAKAREEAGKYRTAIREGRDPLAFKHRGPERQLFQDAAEATMKGLVGAKLSETTVATMRSRLQAYAYPKIGRLEVQSIDADILADMLRPIWTKKPDTASGCARQSFACCASPAQMVTCWKVRWQRRYPIACRSNRTETTTLRCLTLPSRPSWHA